jgi:hypothetical protein
MEIGFQCTRHVPRQRARNLALPSLPRVRWNVPRVHWYYEALRFPTALPAPLRFLRVTVTLPRACVRISDKSDADLRPGSLVLALPWQPELFETETAGRPKFLENPDVPAPCSQTPARPALPSHTADRHGPTRTVRRRLSTKGTFGAQSHGIGTRCLRFAVRLTPPHARLASGCSPGSTRRDWLPAGFRRKVSELESLSPSKLSWRNVSIRCVK